MTRTNIFLAIETTSAGGSISLLKNNVEIDRWSGASAISKSEDVLDEISILLKKNKIERFEINFIVISKNAGSLTGSRIGLALARGLSKSLGCQYKEVCVLESLLVNSSSMHGKILTAIQINKTEFFYQIFLAGQGGANKTSVNATRCNFESLKKLVLDTKPDKVIFFTFFEDLDFATVDTLKKLKIPYISVQKNLAKYIGLYAIIKI